MSTGIASPGNEARQFKSSSMMLVKASKSQPVEDVQ
jgi:hypothetical protein